MGDHGLGRGLIILGGVLVLVGMLIYVGGRWFGLGRLPGDITIRRDHVTIWIPLTTCLLLSVFISLLARLFFRR